VTSRVRLSAVSRHVFPLLQDEKIFFLFLFFLCLAKMVFLFVGGLGGADAGESCVTRRYDM